MATIELLAPLHAEMTAWRQDIHTHPVLGFQENRTACLVTAKLEAFGFDETHRGVGRTGVVSVPCGGRTTRSLGLRADMDALPILAVNHFGQCSVNEGVMHPCDHDGR